MVRDAYRSDLRREIIRLGGIRHTSPWCDWWPGYCPVPPTLIRRHGLALDVIAADLGFDDGNVFLAYLRSVWYHP